MPILGEFQCPNCAGKVFRMTTCSELVVDFGREGAIEGHPFLQAVRGYPVKGFYCAICGHVMEKPLAEQMAQEVI